MQNFIAIYTNECKSYCDEHFFRNLFFTDLTDCTVNIVDNSIDASYIEKILGIISEVCPKVEVRVDHIEVSRDDRSTLFQRNVTESANFLRDRFLKTEAQNFIILESDLLPPTNWVKDLVEVSNQADIIGGLYYAGFHSKELYAKENEVVPTHHVLSGCTLYKREVIEKIPFRWSRENLGAFPDAWISVDAGQAGFKMANYTKIKCFHMGKFGSMTRGQKNLR